MAIKNYAMDSWAMMAFFENEASAESVEKIILESFRGSAKLIMSVINAGELWYSIARAYSESRADAVLDELDALDIEIVDADREITRHAAKYKASGSIAYADCFAAACAKLKKAVLVTGDREFKKLDRKIKIRWI